jgi:hypothetical protein
VPPPDLLGLLGGIEPVEHLLADLGARRLTPKPNKLTRNKSFGSSQRVNIVCPCHDEAVDYGRQMRVKFAKMHDGRPLQAVSSKMKQYQIHCRGH